MRLTSFTDFGLRALMRLAGDPNRLFTTEDLAQEFGISRHHLTKVVRELGAAGVIVTRRGAGGGLQLARPATEISVGRVARQLEGRQALVECFDPDGGACTLTPDCRLKGRLAAAQEAFFRELDRLTLADCAWTPPEPPRAGDRSAPPLGPRSGD